jgi:tetratricopeptide (TPR) repeat protein
MPTPRDPARPTARSRRGRLTAARAAVEAAAAALLALAPAGCASRGARPYDPQREADRDSGAAERLTREAARVMDKDPDKAEALLRKALGADLFFAPAHNDLAALYLRSGLLFEAASEAQWAAKLLPKHPDPRINLGLALERGGRVDDALAAYASALDAYPGHVPASQALARLQLRSGRADERTPALLDAVAMAGETPAWRRWAKVQAAKLRGRAER